MRPCSAARTGAWCCRTRAACCCPTPTVCCGCRPRRSRPCATARRAARCAWAPWKARRRPGCRRCWRPTTRPAAGAHRAGHGHLGRAGGQGARLRTRSGLRGRALSRRGTGVNRGLRRNAGPDFAARLARDRRRAGAGRSHGDRLRVRLFLSPHPGVLARPRRRGAGQGDGVRVLSRDRRLRGGRYGRGHRAALRAGCAGRADRAAGARPAGQVRSRAHRLVWRVDDDTPAVQALRDQLAA